MKMILRMILLKLIEDIVSRNLHLDKIKLNLKNIKTKMIEKKIWII